MIVLIFLHRLDSDSDRDRGCKKDSAYRKQNKIEFKGKIQLEKNQKKKEKKKKMIIHVNGDPTKWMNIEIGRGIETKREKEGQ